NVEVIVVDDGSSSAEAEQCLAALAPEFDRRGWRIVRQPNLYLGAARNTAARPARGKYLYFLDDDNLAKPGGIARLVDIAERTGADILTCFADVFRSTEPPAAGARPDVRLTFVGDCLSYGAIGNVFGDAHSLVRR